MSASDASLVSFLQSELLVLSSEIKKKHPNIKEVRLRTVSCNVADPCVSCIVD